jgi:5-methylcytosine-specific restriction endonuclease McrA
VRLLVLQRDEGLCQLRGPDCRVAADEVDHVVPVQAGGAMYDPVNLRAACSPCNASRGGRAGAAKANAVKRSRRLAICSKPRAAHPPETECDECGWHGPSRVW